MKKYTLILVLILLVSLAFSEEQFEFVKTLTISGSGWKIHRLENLTQQKTHKGMAFILNEFSSKNIADMDLCIDFEKPLKNLLNYKVISANYGNNIYQYSQGKVSGKFYYPNHYISLRPLSTSIFYQGKVPGSFTIEFWLYVYKSYDNQYVLRYVGHDPSDETDRNDYGFSVVIKNNKLRYEFDNFFWSINNEPYSLTITDNKNIQLKKWEHHAISFDIMRGKIATYKNGIEQNTKWVTTDGKFLSPIYNPYIKEDLSTPLLIGKNAFFSLDNLKITKNTLSTFQMQRYNNKDAKLITEVYKISDKPISLRQIKCVYHKGEYSHIRMAYRISDEYFMPDNSDIEWVYFKNGIAKFPKEYREGKYVQLKIIVYPYEDNSQKIEIDSLTINYVEDKIPDAPLLLSAVAGDRYVELSWTPSTENDVVAYEIYYGNRKENYICDDSSNGESPILYRYIRAGKLKFVSYILDGLRNDKPYFISVRSLDKNGNRSAFSRELYARPNSVENTDRFSIGD